MIEPFTLSVPELADRWSVTPRQIIEQALAQRLPILFLFDGLAFDYNDRWLRGIGAWAERREAESLRKMIESREAHIRRNAAGLTGEFDRLSSEEVIEERRAINHGNRKLLELEALLEAREDERTKHECIEYMRALPKTLLEIMQHGETAFPSVALHPQSAVVVKDHKGTKIWDGQMVALESGRAGHWHSKLSAADLLVPMAAIKGLEGGSGDIREAQSPAPRRDLMASVIEQAQKRCDNAEDASAVWVKLVDMANKGLSPLIGVSEDGIKWLDGNDQPQFLTLKNLRDRLRRRKAR